MGEELGGERRGIFSFLAKKSNRVPLISKLAISPTMVIPLWCGVQPHINLFEVTLE